MKKIVVLCFALIILFAPVNYAHAKFTWNVTVEQSGGKAPWWCFWKSQGFENRESKEDIRSTDPVLGCVYNCKINNYGNGISEGFQPRFIGNFVEIDSHSAFISSSYKLMTDYAKSQISIGRMSGEVKLDTKANGENFYRKVSWYSEGDYLKITYVIVSND